MLKEKVENVIKKIRPAIQIDGGDIELVDVTEDGVVKLRMLGACHGCPISMITLKQGIEQTLKEEIPEIKSVEEVI